MKKIFLVFVLGASLTCAARADNTTNSTLPKPPPPPPGGGAGGQGMGGGGGMGGMGGGMGGMGMGGMGMMGGLSQDDVDELREAREAALQADPALAAEGKALQEKQREYQKKVEAAMIKADPDVASILAQLEAMRQQFQGGMGGDQPKPPHPAATPAPSTKPTGQ